MNPDERNLLGRFLQDLTQARGGLKDAEASDMIERTLRSNPDAGYLLVQHAIVADQALHAAQDRIAELERQAAQGGAGARSTGGSFLGGAATGGPWQGGGGQPGYAPQQAAYAPQQPTYAPQPPTRGGGLLGGLFGGGAAAQPVQQGGFGSFLRTAGTTAAGVAGGEFLFNGLSNLFGGGRGYGGGFGGGPAENVTINEYGDGGGDPGFDGGYDDGGVGGGDGGDWS